MSDRRGRASASRDVLLGMRFAFAGGRDGWTRTVLTAVGVGIGVALLLLAAAVPGALQARQERTSARSDLRLGEQIPAAADTMLVGQVDTSFRQTPVHGRLLHPEGPRAPIPPGLTAVPRPGEVVVSPALKDLLDSPDGPLFAPRLDGARVTGTIRQEGLSGPGELAFYRGVDALPADEVTRLRTFGDSPSSEGLGTVLTILVVIIIVVLLLPIAVFLAAAVRFGSESRDRRMAALRLIGADRRMTRLMAAGETTAGACLGLVVGGVLFLVGRQIAPMLSLWDISVYASDVRPSIPLVAVIAVAVPALSVAVSVLALRGVAIEPLGVTRRATPPRRRLWWRLILPGTGLALLVPLVGGLPETMGGVVQYQVAAGAVLLLIGAVTVLPWVIELVVRPLRGGPVGWQLAVRRLQLDSAMSARLVNGIAVAVAGAIALQMLFAAVQKESTVQTRQDPSRAQAQIRTHDPASAGPIAVRLRATPGVTRVTETLVGGVSAEPPAGAAGQDPAFALLQVGDCAALAEYADLGSCAGGDVFIARATPVDPGAQEAIRPGATVTVTVGDGGPRWTVPGDARQVPARRDPSGVYQDVILATPGAIDARAVPRSIANTFVSLDPGDPDAMERVRNVVAQLDPVGTVATLAASETVGRFDGIRRGLYVGVVVTLLLIGASMLVGTVEQLRDRRRMLAMLVAVGTRRSALSWSVFWQTFIPVMIGLALAVVFGLGLGVALLRMVSVPVSIDWATVAISAGIGAAVVLLVTALSLPTLWRLTRPEGLRVE
ncbi:ABC transporter permease [Planotetraspora kaengkrachanensis]|uniref:Membrane protein n=1 Tax=Planotetraspora kaengkrachanensis TaxID=575193 RepID=A0A8J3PWS3_9ACTN|nr:ABC transporter permease [Planotetraspora kaengkrachanensis]GIG82402.1 membrane protein [Planotetraspora kaengkrachanensis]